MPWLCSAQFRPTQTKFLAAKSWKGTYTIDVLHTGSGTGVIGPYSYKISRKVRATLNLDKQRLGGWEGTATGTVEVNEEVVTNSPGCVITNTIVGTQNLGAKGPHKVSLTFDLDTDTFSIWFNDPFVDLPWRADWRCGSVTQTPFNEIQMTRWTSNGTDMGLKFPATGFAMKSQQAVVTDVHNGLQPPSGVKLLITENMAWDLTPVVHELEVIIEPEGHDQWRPEAAGDEKTPGNDIAVKATLQWDDRAPLSEIDKARKFEFRLADISKEPGIVMNYPSAAKAKGDPDLQFDKARNDGLPLILTGTDQAESIGAPHEKATAIVSAYDWGAWGVIKVIATTVDGRRVEGYLKDDKQQKDVRLPKRDKDSFIADRWKSSQGVSGKDDVDDDNDPEGDGHKGDGLTLYEEYRGFYESGKRIEGNPKKKDLFVQNRIGADAKQGITVFTLGAGLEVHDELTPDEMADDRLINFNRDRSPKRTDQHGIIVKIDPAAASPEAWDPRGGDPGPPKTTTYVRIPPLSGSFFTTDYNLRASSQVFLVEKAIAHELLHASSVFHHGQTDYELDLQIAFPGGLANPGTAEIGRTSFGKWLKAKLTDESTGQDRTMTEAARFAAAANRLQAQVDGGANRTDVLIQSLLLYGCDLLGLPDKCDLPSLYLGVKGGQHSGDYSCLMTYFFAQAYQHKDGGEDYYYIDTPQEFGLNLCSSAKGAGVNDDGRSPQSRHGDATKGNCTKQLCINDAFH